ncbi:MAG: glycosyltransferase [Sphingomonadales bacterium]
MTDLSVCHVITGLARGGAEAMLYKLLAESDHMHAAPVVISLTDKGVYGQKIEALGIPLHCIGMRRGLPGPAAFRRLRALIRKLQPDIIQGWMYHGALAALAVSGHRPVVLAIRHTPMAMSDEKPLTRVIIHTLARLSRHASAITYNAQVSEARHLALGYDRGRSLVIPNGFDTHIFQPDAARRLKTRGRLGVSPDQILILHLARFHPMKDHAGLLDAIQRIKTRHLVFLMAGTGVTPDNPAFVNCDQRVRLLGERDDVPDLLQAADILVNPSWSEAFPNVLGEAMACGVPCVATDVGDSAYIVGDTGIIVPPRNGGALAYAIERLAALSFSERQEIGIRARARIVENFSITRVAAQYQCLYELIVAENQAKGRSCQR